MSLSPARSVLFVRTHIGRKFGHEVMDCGGIDFRSLSHGYEIQMGNTLNGHYKLFAINSINYKYIMAGHVYRKSYNYPILI